MLATSVELVQAETELSSLKTDVMMTANRCSDLTFWLLIIIVFAIVNTIIIYNYFITITIATRDIATYSYLSNQYSYFNTLAIADSCPRHVK